MDDKEFQQMKLAFKFMEQFADVPAMGADDEYWKRESDALTKWMRASDDHPLCVKLGIALHEYLEGRSLKKAYEERMQRAQTD